MNYFCKLKIDPSLLRYYLHWYDENYILRADCKTQNQKRQSVPTKAQGTDSSQNFRRARPLTATKISSHISGTTSQFRRNTTRSHSFRARPISAGHRGKFSISHCVQGASICIGSHFQPITDRIWKNVLGTNKRLLLSTIYICI